MAAKQSKRRWAAMLTGIGVIASVIGILVFLTGRNLPDFFASPGPSASPTSSPSTKTIVPGKLDVSLTVIPGSGLKQVGTDAYEIEGTTSGYPNDYRAIQVYYQASLDGKPVQGLCSTKVNLRNWFDGDHTIHSSSCADTVPTSDDTIEFNVWPEVVSPDITIDVAYGTLSTSKKLTIKVLYPGE